MKELENTYSKFQIIIIEDDEGLGRLMQKELKRNNYNVLLAETGEKALSLIKGEKTEILLLDYKLPDITGMQLIQKLRETKGYIPNFITLTGYGNEKTAVEMMKLGSRDYIIKDQHFLDLLLHGLNRVCLDLENEINLEKTKARLNKKIELLRETGDMARVGGWEIDLNSNTVLWTDATKKIHEVDEDYLPDLSSAIDFFPGEARKKIEEAVAQAIAKGKSYSLEVPFVTAKGNNLWVITQGNPKMENGKCIRLHGTFQDITKRKQAEMELKKKTAVLQRTEQIANVGSWDWNIETDTVTWSEELFRIFKRKPELGAVSYAEHPKIYTPASMKKLDEAVQKCIKTGKSFELDLEIIRGDGKTAFCTSRGYAKKDENGKLVQLYGSFQDITYRKETEEKLRAAYQQIKASEQQLMAINQQLEAFNQQLISGEQQLKAANQQLTANEQQLRAANQQLEASEKALLENNKTLKRYLDVAAEIIISLDEKGNIKLLNESGHRILEYKPGELIGKNWFSTCLPKEEGEKVQNFFLNLKTSKTEDAFNFENEIVTKSGERKVILWHNTIFRDADGNFTGTLSSGEDITLRKRNEKLLISAKEKAQESDRLKSAFLANMSHEIRTPMNGILGFTELLKNPELSGEQKQEFIEIILKSGNRMLETVNAIIDISRIETGQINVTHTELNVNEEIRALHSFFAHEAGQKGLQFTVEKLLPETCQNWTTDKSKFISVLTNLLKNALKYTEKGSVSVGCYKKGSNLYCYVKDTGIGVPLNRQKAIFNRFEQADIEDTRAFQGSGLGLAIAKAYVEMLGGKIGVDSTEGEGSIFWFNIPQNEVKKRMEPDGNKITSENNNTRKLKVIIAEDDQVSAQYLSVLMKNKAHEILLATSGNQTVELCKKHADTDLVLMDIKMPEGNGYEALKEIRKFNSSTKIIAQTANALTGDRQKALDAGFDEYVSKPISKQELLTKIDQLLQLER